MDVDAVWRLACMLHWPRQRWPLFALVCAAVALSFAAGRTVRLLMFFGAWPVLLARQLDPPPLLFLLVVLVHANSMLWAWVAREISEHVRPDFCFPKSLFAAMDVTNGRPRLQRLRNALLVYVCALAFLMTTSGGLVKSQICVIIFIALFLVKEEQVRPPPRAATFHDFATSHFLGKLLLLVAWTFLLLERGSGAVVCMHALSAINWITKLEASTAECKAMMYVTELAIIIALT